VGGSEGSVMDENEAGESRRVYPLEFGGAT